MLPEDKFKKGKLKVTLPFKQLDLIFNHKNIWANLQAPDPAVIWYDLHDQERWLPLIQDKLIAEKHPRLQPPEELND